MSRFVLCLLCAAMALTLVVPDRAQAAQLAHAGGAATDADLQVEMLFWDSIKSSTDAGDYQAYIESYPRGKFAPLARARIKRYAPPAGGTAPAIADEAPKAKSAAAPAATTATGKPVYVPRGRRAGATPPSSPPEPQTYVARTRAWVYRKPTTKVARSGEFFVEAESFKVTEVLDGGRWLKVITRSGKTGYVYGGQAYKKGHWTPNSIFMNPDQDQPRNDETEMQS